MSPEARRDIDSVRAWLRGLPMLDLEDIVADGGITAGMVIQTEAVEMAARLERALRPASEPKFACAICEDTGLATWADDCPFCVPSSETKGLEQQ